MLRAASHSSGIPGLTPLDVARVGADFTAETHELILRHLWNSSWLENKEKELAGKRKSPSTGTGFPDLRILALIVMWSISHWQQTKRKVPLQQSRGLFPKTLQHRELISFHSSLAALGGRRRLPSGLLGCIVASGNSQTRRPEPTVSASSCP